MSHTSDPGERRRRMYPMPVAPIIDHPLMVAMPSAGYGMVMRLCHHFWQTDCAPLPIAEFELRHIARAHAPTWRTWKTDVLAVVAEVLPPIEKYYRWRVHNSLQLAQSSQKGQGAKRLNAMRQSRAAFDAVHNAAPTKRKAKTEAPAKVAAGAGWASD